MIPTDHPLLLTRETVLYRIARRRYAGLSGMGAALYPGRWNEIGQEAIYTSLHPATCVLEYLAHLDKRLIPTNLVMMHIKCHQEMSVNAFHTLELATFLFRNGGFAELGVVSLPSVVVPAAQNVVLYPTHPFIMRNFFIDAVMPFEYDPRLFPETAVREA